MQDSDRWNLIHKKIHDPVRVHSSYAEEKEALFPRNSIIADLGGGTGEDALFFLQKGHKVVLLDISQFALDVASEKAKKVGSAEKLVTRLVDFGLHDLPLRDNSVDVVYSRISLNYFPKDQTVKIFRDIYRVLKPRGNAYLTFKSPDDENEMELLKNTCSEYEPFVYIQNGQLKSRFPVNELQQIVLIAGITDGKVERKIELLEKDPDGKEYVLLVNEVNFVKNS